ncbi:hypothetical protein BDZ88DRAFT_410597 [Geranomyces variabilis]|nr:hypothetical protein BDZ88DRAFT_410597 [Geranomyces variabilis]
MFVCVCPSEWLPLIPTSAFLLATLATLCFRSRQMPERLPMNPSRDRRVCPWVRDGVKRVETPCVFSAKMAA